MSTYKPPSTTHKPHRTTYKPIVNHNPVYNPPSNISSTDTIETTVIKDNESKKKQIENYFDNTDLITIVKEEILRDTFIMNTTNLQI